MPSKTIVLLGAGASVEAGLPTMFGLVESFRQSLTGDELQLFEDVVRVLEVQGQARIPPRPVDVELLIETLDVLGKRDEHPLASFVKPDGWLTFTSRAVGTAVDVRRKLFAHLRAKLDVDPTRVAYLHPLVELGIELRGLDIFTLNYDAAVEIACEQMGVEHTDGFDASWNPSLLGDEARFTIRLHKLHGSLLWYHTGSRIVKVPLRPGKFPTAGTHIGGQPLEEVMIYPGPGKALYSEPYADLMERFRSALLSADQLVVAGCSLRDIHVRRAVLERMRANRTLRVAIVDPSADSVVRTSDAILGDDLLFSQSEDRIVFLPRGAGDAFAERAVLDFISGATRVGQAGASWSHARRTQARNGQRLAAGGVLWNAMVEGHWGVVYSMRSRLADPAITEAWASSIRSVEVVSDPNFWLCLLTIGCEEELESLARISIVRSVRKELRYVWESKERKLVLADGESVETLSRETSGTDGKSFFGKRAEELNRFRNSLNYWVKQTAFHMPAEHLDLIARLNLQLDAAAEYFDASFYSPQRVPMMTRDFGAISVLAGPPDVRERVGHAIARAGDFWARPG